MSDLMTWEDHQQWERSWHGDCINSWNEETKQQVYAKRMGLEAIMELGKYPVYDLKEISILDVGCGPYSLLLKCKNFKGYGIDPCDYPKWVAERYKEAGIEYKKMLAEDTTWTTEVFDEVWMYNVLQHTQDPELIMKNMRRAGKVLRIFEWIETEQTPGHPHILQADKLNEWVGGIGATEELHESGCYGKCWYGVFKGDNYEK